MINDPQFRPAPRASIQRPMQRGVYARPAASQVSQPPPQTPPQFLPEPLSQPLPQPQIQPQYVQPNPDPTPGPTFIPSPLEAIAKAEPQPVPQTLKRSKFARLKNSARFVARVINKKRVYVPVASLAILALAGYGAYVGVQYVKTQGSPKTIYADALNHALSVRSVHINEQIAGNGSSLAEQYDKTIVYNSKGRPTSSASSTIAISHAGYKIESFGTSTDTFFRYRQLPPGIAPNTSKAINEKWVQMRQVNALPAGAPAALFNATDPRSLAFGPLLFGNISSAAATKLADFYVQHKIFSFDDLNVKRETIDGTTTLVFKGKFNADYAKIAIRSLSSTVGYSATDAQRAVDRLAAYGNAKSTLWVDTNKRMPVKLMLTATDNTTATYSFDKINNATLPATPKATVAWPEFANTQLQIESQASATVAASNRDSDRISALSAVQKNLLAYYTKNGSYPTLANMNDQTWVAANLTSFDPDITRDPAASSLALLAAIPAQAAAPVNTKTKSKIVVPVTPIFGYVYKPTNAAGAACLNQANIPTDQLCSAYTLSATLSNGQQYIVKNP